MHTKLIISISETRFQITARWYSIFSRAVMWLLVYLCLMVFISGCGSDNRPYPNLPHDHPLNTNINDDFEKRKNIKFRR